MVRRDVTIVKPLIGITPSLEKHSFSLPQDNVGAVLAAGGIPVILPYLTDAQQITEIAGKIDGLLLSGGGDINPFYFDEEPIPGLGQITPERDDFEISLVKAMLVQNKPILGICRGCQILNIAVGGNMYQDLYTQIDRPLLQHTQQAPREHVSHLIKIVPESLLHEMMGETEVKVNSFHHQAIRHLPNGFTITARSSDQVIEAFESKTHRFVVGVQWHPENLYRKDERMLRLFQRFIMACKENTTRGA
nr:gamma-glutamyl-gamma-aminobutyrate hydrolase family protein [Ammoniphilus resinae]